ncbi:MAG: DUF697 domain-containing protein [Acetobacteraceae bacterium]|nr:DUF697 domain-containing protein [Acetobacteraceae bacterium]
MVTAPEPFLVLEAEEAPRLEAVAPNLPTPARFGRQWSPAPIGVLILCIGFPALWSCSLLGTLFDRWYALGWAGLAMLLAGLGMIGLGIGRELRGLSALGRVDRLRAEFASGEAERVERAAQLWLERLPQHSRLLPALAAAGTPEAVLALLRSGPAQDLQAATDGLGRAAALQSIAVVAATPSPAMDVLTVGWCGVRLIRQIAVLHGMRPGFCGTVLLLRKTALAAATVAATEFAVNAATHAMVSHPLLRHLVGDMAGAGVAARRMIVLARAAALACSPLPPG